jgi:hypothetical protein
MKYYFVLYRNILFGRTSGKSEVVSATDLYTALDVCLSVFHVQNLLHVTT